MTGRSAPSALASFLLALLVFGSTAGCSDETSAAGGEAEAVLVQRSADPRLVQAREALAAGRPSSAETLLEKLGAQAGVEGPLALARAHLARGDVIEALRHVERARALDPEDPRVFATSAEVLALAGEGPDAVDELNRGLALAPGCPDLLRAQAILDLTRPGRGPIALQTLQKALELDPTVPYTDWPLAQAYLLSGRSALGSGDRAQAIVAARAALGLVPDLAAAEELQGQALAAAKDWEGAIAAYKRAQDLGLDQLPLLLEAHRGAAMTARLASNHDNAEEHYLALRDLALSPEDLGASGEAYLADRARVAFEEGQKAKLSGDHKAAAGHFAASVRLAPDGPLSVDALDGQAGARFRLADYSGAASLWTDVQSRELAGEAPEVSRTHLNLARAYVLGGRPERAHEVLDAYLERWPDGPAAAETSKLRAAVPPK